MATPFRLCGEVRGLTSFFATCYMTTDQPCQIDFFKIFLKPCQFLKFRLFKRHCLAYDELLLYPYQNLLIPSWRIYK